MAVSDVRIVDLSREANALLAGQTDFLRIFAGDESEGRRQRRAIIVAALRRYELDGEVGISLDELAADIGAVLRYRGELAPDDILSDCADILRQLESWEAVDSAIAPQRARIDGGLRRRVERDYALGRPMRVFMPHWDEVQRSLRRRFVSLSANYFAQAAAALDMLLAELTEPSPDSLRCFTAWQTARQSLHGVSRESHDFARELRSITVDPNHPEILADVADRLGMLYDKFYRVAHEGAAMARARVIRLKDEPHDGKMILLLQKLLRIHEDEWSVGLGETEEERAARIEAIGSETAHEIQFFERLTSDIGNGSWRDGIRLISLALVELTERIHTAIALRLQQTQAIDALTRRAALLAEGNEETLQSARVWLWNASGSFHAALWTQDEPSSDERIQLERWLEGKGGSALPLVDEETWLRSYLPRKRAAIPPPPSALLTDEDWDPGSDSTLQKLETARANLAQRMIAAGSAEQLQTLESFDELRILAQLLWLPRESAPLRRLGLKIGNPAKRGAQRAFLKGPTFEVELDNYRFLPVSVQNKEDIQPQFVDENLQQSKITTLQRRLQNHTGAGDTAAPVVPAAALKAPAGARPIPAPEPDEQARPDAVETSGDVKPQQRRLWPFQGNTRQSSSNPPKK